MDDAHTGGKVTQDVTVTITGTNDAPTIVGAATTPTGTVTEDDQVVSGNISADGTVTFQDLDLIDTHTATSVFKTSSSSAHLPGFTEGSTQLGTFTLDANVTENNGDTNNIGSVGWHFALDDSNPMLQSLAEGQVITQIYTVTLTDNNGAPVTQDVTVTIVGTNDGPTIVGASTTPTGTVVEDDEVVDGNISADGTVTFQDLDLIDTHTATVTFKSSSSTVHLPGFIEGSTHIGTLTLDANVSENNGDTSNIGSVGWHFVLDDNDPMLQSLAYGQTITQVYTITLTDNNGAPVTQDVTITIKGANDGPNNAPTIVVEQTTATGTVIEDDQVSSGNIAANGTITFQDLDLIDTHTASVAFTSSSSSAHLPGFIEGSTHIGTLTLDANVTEDSGDTDNLGSVGWHFVLDDSNPVLQSLAEGESITQIYTVTVTDNNGAPVTQDVTVTIIGANDGPTIVGASTTPTGTVTEDDHVSGGNIATNGTITFQDLDLIDTHTATVAFTSSSSSDHLPGFTEGSTHIGTLTLDANVTENNGDTNNLGSVGWHFVLDDSNPVLQSLAEGQSITQTYTVTVTDNNGEPVTQDVTVTIIGANDGPTIVGASTTPTGTVTEDDQVSGGNIAANGTITFRDVDLVDTHTASVAFTSSSSSAHLPGFIEGSTNIGTLTLDANVTENSGDTNNIGSVGWHFVLDDSNPMLQSLAEGESITQVYTVTVTDNNGAPVTQDVTVTITGANDGPTIVGASTTPTGTVVEDDEVSGGHITTDGTITFRDLDLIDTHTASVAFTSSSSSAHLPGFIEGSTHIGTLTLDANVAENSGDTDNIGSVGWHFVLDDSDPMLQSLAEGQTITQVYTVTVTDNNGAPVTQDVTVTITGANDGPTVEAATTTLSGDVTEDSQVDLDTNAIATSGNIDFGDLDLTDLHAATVVLKSSDANADLPGFAEGTGAGAAHIGTFALNVTEDNTDTINTGSVGWSFTLDNDNYVLQSLAEDQTITQVYTVTVPDGHGASISKDVTVTIHGTNDDPHAANVALTSAPPGDGWVFDPDNGHYYRYVEESVNFADATSAASGDGAYLATITSAAENTFIANLPGVGSIPYPYGVWTGGATSDANPDGNPSDPSHWSWSGGPETGASFTYANWHSGEPNGGFGSTDAAMQISADGTWNDVPSTPGWNAGYVEEWGGRAGDPVAEDSTRDFSTATLLAQASDVDKIDVLTVSSVSATSADGAAVTLSGGTITYDPTHAATLQALAVGETATDTFSYTVSDGHGGTSTATATVNVVGQNDAPVFVNNGPLTFSTHAYSAGAGPEILAVADFNGDGSPDLAVPDIYGNSISILLNDGSGGFGDPVNYPIGVHPNTVAAGDLNHDGYVDLVTVPGDFSAHVSVLLGDGTGQFQVQSTTYPIPLNALVPDLADLNGDGNLDVVVGDGYSGTGFTVRLGDGHGTFGAPASYGGGRNYDASRLADVNNDGKLDIVAATNGGFAVLLGDGNGGFGGPTVVATGGGSVDVGDLNGDGNIDVVTDTPSGLQVLLGNGDGTYQTPIVYSAVNGGVTVGDVNGDGKPDVVLTSYSGNSVSVFLGNGDGTLQDPTTYPAGQNPIHGAIADLNGDGKPDLIVSDVEGGSVTVLLNTSSGSPSANFTEGAATTDVASGALLFTDVDASDTHSFTVTCVTPSGTTSGLPDADTVKGWLSLGAKTDSSNGATGSQAWAFSAADANFDYLADGQQVTLTYAVQMSDGHGGTATHDVTITVTGTNDAPQFTGNDLAPTYSAGDSSVAIVSGVSASDIDSSNYAEGTLTATVTAGGQQGDTLSIDHNQYIELVGTTVMYDADGDGPGSAVTIGTLTNYDYNSLTVTLNGNADDAAVAKLTQAIEFSNSTADPTAGERTVTFTLQDGGGTAHGGHDSAYFTAEVTVSEADNHGPIVENSSWITRVSVDSNDFEGGGDSFAGAVSNAGVAAFSSDADNLVDEDANGDMADIFIHRLNDGTTERVNVSSSGDEANSQTFDGPSISANGNFVVFESAANNLVDGDTNDAPDIFVHNVETGATVRVSLDDLDAELPSESMISNHAISDDGRYVVFETQALGAEQDQNHTWDVYVRDLLEGTTELVSARNNSIWPGSGASNYGLISGDGRFVVFNSAVDGLDDNAVDDNGHRDVYIRDLANHTTTLVSAADDPDFDNSAAYGVSGDGRYVLYTSEVESSGDNVLDLFVRDMQTGEVTLINEDDKSYFTSADISADGRYVVYSAMTPDGYTGVFVYDMTSQITMQVSVDANGNLAEGQSTSEYPAISANGRFITFDSDASNLVDDDGNGSYDAFVVDLAAPARTIHDNGNGQQATFGLLAFTDEDVNDTHTAADVTPWSQAGYVGSFVVESTPSESGGHGTFAWHYQVDHSAIANLADGESITQSYLVKISDGTGFTYEAVDVTLVGVNDAPVITSDGGGENASVSVAENTTAVTTVTATDVDDGSSRSYSVVTGAGSPDAAKFTINPTTGALSFVNAPDYEAPGSAAGSNTYTVQVQVDDGAGGVDVQTLTVNVTDDAEAPVAPALVAQTFLGGSGDQGATDVSYANGHLYLTYNALPVLQQPSDHSTVLSFSTAPDGTPAQDFSYSWTKGFFYGVASDGANIYAVGASHPGSGLTSDGIGGAEDKTLLATFNANGTAGSSPAPATDYAASNFFPGYQGVELFQDVLVTTQGGNTVLYAVGHGQPPTANGGYVIASYDSNDNLLHTATEPVSGGFSIARDVVEFNGQIWAVGYSEHAGPIGRPTAWAANYDLSSVTMYADTAGSAAGDFSGATVIGSNLYAVGYVTSNGNDYLVAKYDTAGNVVWSASFGGTGSDMLTSAVSLNGHLYVVGTTNDGYGHTDGVLMEISTADGSVISTTTYGGELDDAFNSITTDGHYLYVAGESKSFTAAGEDDAILLTYDVSGGPVIDTEHFTTDSAGNNAPTTITGLAVTDSNAAETLTFSAVTAQSGSGSTIMPSSGSGDLSTVNAAINSVVYDPGATPPLTDEITFTVSGPSGSDTVNFVFQQAGNSPNPTLVGGNGKDVIFGTEGSDTLTGGASHDQFVFGPTSGGLVQHTVTDFETPLDKIDLREFDSIHSIGDLVGVTQQGNDTLITIDANDKILLQNVQATNIHATNFLFHV